MEQHQPARTYQLKETPATAIVVHCSDPRFQTAFREFIGHELALAEGEYIPLVISGGVASLSEPLRLPKEFKFMKERIEFFFDRFDTITRLVLINHEDCRHYEMLASVLGKLFARGARHIGERQMKDLKTVATTLLPYLRPGIQIELFYARRQDAGSPAIVFDRVL